MTTHEKPDDRPGNGGEVRRWCDAIQATEMFFVSAVVALGAAEYLKAAPCVLSILAIMAFARWLETAIENEYEERRKNVITYYDFGHKPHMPKSAIKVAAVDEYGRIVHYYTGYASHRDNTIKLYPGEYVRGISYQPDKRTIPEGDLKSYEGYLMFCEEVKRRCTPSNELRA